MADKRAEPMAKHLGKMLESMMADRKAQRTVEMMEHLLGRM